jgi:5-methylcytosine-specific restriction endonuclease McrA
VGTRRRSSIPRLEIPSYGMPMPQQRPRYRRYDSRKARRNRLLALVANPLCRRCGAVAVEVHHIVPLSAGGHPSDFGNLEPLCVDCHARVHGKRYGKPLPPPPPDRGPDWCPLY